MDRVRWSVSFYSGFASPKQSKASKENFQKYVGRQITRSRFRIRSGTIISEANNKLVTEELNDDNNVRGRSHASLQHQ